MFKVSSGDWRLLGLLLNPSWLSGLVAVAAGLIVSIGLIVAFQANNSLLDQQLLSWQQDKPQPTLTTPNQVLVSPDRPTLKGSWPLLLLWSLAGLVVYAIAAAVVGSLAKAEGLRESLDYVHARPRSVLVSTTEHVLLRVIAAVVLIIFVIAFWRQVVPYSITAAHASSADVLSLDGGLYALLSFALIAVSLHVAAILVRLSMGRARVFSGA